MRILVAAPLMAAGALAISAANAQTGPATSGQAPVYAQAQSPAPSTNIPDQKLDQAAAALEQVTSIRKDYEGKLASADPSDKSRLVDEARNALEKAVTDQGLSVDEYVSIMQVAQNDPEIRGKLLQRLHPKD
jgi:hypothetical protein